MSNINNSIIHHFEDGVNWCRWREFHHPSLGDSWTYCWRLLSDCSVLAVWSNLNQQPIHSHLPHQRGSCKQISPTFVTYPASFLMQISLCSVVFWTMRHWKITSLFFVWEFNARFLTNTYKVESNHCLPIVVPLTRDRYWSRVTANRLARWKIELHSILEFWFKMERYGGDAPPSLDWKSKILLLN